MAFGHGAINKEECALRDSSLTRWRGLSRALRLVLGSGTY